MLGVMNDNDDDMLYLYKFLLFYLLFDFGLIQDDIIRHFSASGNTSHQLDC